MKPVSYGKSVIVRIVWPAPKWDVPTTGYAPTTGTHTSIKAKTVQDNTQTTALALRAEWMKLMGFAEDEISAACIDDGSPVDVNDELENLRCARDLKNITPPRSVLKSWAIVR